MGFPEDCDICLRAKLNAHLFDGNIELDLRPIKGANPSVMLVGQDPTVARRVIYSALDLENKGGLLYGYIVGQILAPAGLELDDVYATDLVKCRFPHNQTPNAISNRHHMSVEEFLSPFFANCRQWFVQEVDEIQPKIILSLGQPVHQLLVEEFDWPIPSRMRDAFGDVYWVSLAGYRTLYAPCIHINSRGHRLYIDGWPRFVENLRRVAASWRL